MESFRHAGQPGGQAQAIPTGGDDFANYESSATNTQHVPVQEFRETGEKKSAMRFFCYAKAANNKERDSLTIEFFPMEHLPFVDGEINEDQEDYTAGGQEYVGGGYNASVKSSNALSADWLREGQSNRMTAPDVRRGERLKIWQYADADKYYWETFGQDNDLRKLETVVFAYNANPEEDTKTDFDNSYSLEISTHDKVIRLHTTEKNGEFCGYDLEINPGEGYVLLKDTIGNFIHMESSQNRIELKNASGSHYDMNKEDLRIFTPRSIIYETINYRVNAATIEHHASLYDFTWAPAIAHMGVGYGSVATSRAWRIETSTMDFEGGYISEATQKRVIQSDEVKIGTPSDAARSGGAMRMAANAGNGHYPGYDNGNYDTASGFNAGGNATADQSSIGTDLGDRENADNTITMVARSHDTQTQELTVKADTHTVETGQQTTRADKVDFDTPQVQMSNRLDVGQRIEAPLVYGGNLAYAEE